MGVTCRDEIAESNMRERYYEGPSEFANALPAYSVVRCSIAGSGSRCRRDVRSASYSTISDDVPSRGFVRSVFGQRCKRVRSWRRCQVVE